MSLGVGNLQLESHRDLVGFAPSTTNPRVKIVYRHKPGVNQSSVICVGEPLHTLHLPVRPLGKAQLKGKKFTSVKPHSLPLFPGLPGIDTKATTGLCRLCHYYTRVTLSKPSLCQGVMTIDNIYNKYSASISYRVQSRLYNHATEQEYVNAAREMLYVRNLIKTVAIPKPGYRELPIPSPVSKSDSVTAQLNSQPSIEKRVSISRTPLSKTGEDSKSVERNIGTTNPVFLTSLNVNATMLRGKVNRHKKYKYKQGTTATCTRLGITYTSPRKETDQRSKPDKSAIQNIQQKSLSMVHLHLPSYCYSTAVRRF